MNLLYLTVMFPLAGFLLLAFSCGRWSENLSATIGISSIGLSVLITIWVVLDFFDMHLDNNEIFTQTLWCWISIDNFQIPINFVLDNLSLTMLVIIVSISFLIHIYASWYMRGEKGYSRFFAYTNLFIASMLILVLADNLLLMYLGWEIVGLCSYLLIGFYYRELKNGISAIKAFIMTRIGDVMLVFALFIFYDQFGNLNLHDLGILAQKKLVDGSPTITWAIIMLLGGAISKSAQLPLQTWLADAMVGPTPASALIHAATMVTAGVYLIARTYDLFMMAPEILHLVGIIGAITLVLASFSALMESDIKRVLAYSTMSQVGYMFLALGVQALEAAIFHLITHAFFKALLFLSSGSLILACQHEQNIFKIGNLKKSIPLVYICLLVGGASLSALPLVTAGFYSKDEILWQALVNGHNMLMLIGLAGTFLTSLYTFRLIFILFHGKERINSNTYYGINHHLPLILLMVLSTFVGALAKPILGEVISVREYNNDYKLILEITSSIIVVIGICLAAFIWLRQRHLLNIIATSTLGRFFSLWCFYAWGFDWLYNKIFVRFYLAIAWLLARDPFNAMMNFPALLVRYSSRNLTISENGQLRWYLASLSLGAIVVVALLVFLKEDL